MHLSREGFNTERIQNLPFIRPSIKIINDVFKDFVCQLFNKIVILFFISFVMGKTGRHQIFTIISFFLPFFNKTVNCNSLWALIL